jgi:hypothetical protein
MALIDEEIRGALREFIKATISTSSLLGTVVSVDTENKTCVVKDDDRLKKVRLRPVIDDKEGLTVYPKVGTWCLSIMIEDDEDFMCVGFGEVDKWRLKIGDITVEVTSNGIVFNGGDFGGLLKLAESVERWNKIEIDINNLKTAFASWAVVPSDGGAALKAITASWASNHLTATVTGDVENNKVKQ